MAAGQTWLFGTEMAQETWPAPAHGLGNGLEQVHIGLKCITRIVTLEFGTQHAI